MIPEIAPNPDADQPEVKSLMPDLKEMAIAIDSCHRQIHILNAIVIAMTESLDKQQASKIMEMISAAVDSYQPIAIKNSHFTKSNHEAISAIALAYETAITGGCNA